MRIKRTITTAKIAAGGTITIGLPIESPFCLIYGLTCQAINTNALNYELRVLEDKNLATTSLYTFTEAVSANVTKDIDNTNAGGTTLDYYRYGNAYEESEIVLRVVNNSGVNDAEFSIEVDYEPLYRETDSMTVNVASRANMTWKAR